MIFDFTQKYVLENDYVRLEPLELTDYDRLVYFSENEPEIWAYNAGGANGKENLEKYLNNAILQRTDEREYPFIVFDKKTQQYVGSTRFYAILLENKTLEIGYTWYGTQYQRTGVNKNCKYLLLEFAFDQLQMERVAFAANSENTKSLNAMKSIGCVVEGLLRNASRDAFGKRIDVVRLSILKTEWEESVKKKLFAQIEKRTASLSS